MAYIYLFEHLNTFLTILYQVCFVYCYFLYIYIKINCINVFILAFKYFPDHIILVLF